MCGVVSCGGVGCGVHQIYRVCDEGKEVIFSTISKVKHY